MFALVCTLSTAACTERDPLDSATMAATGDSGGDPTEAPPNEPPGDPGTTGTATTGTTTTTGDGPLSTTVLDTGDPTSDTFGGAPVLPGQFLLVVSTVVAPQLPLQFVATHDVTSESGTTWLRTQLQPLAIEQGKVTTPRTPVGELLVPEPIPVWFGEFEMNLGTVMVSGAANPITGGDIVASLKLTGEFVSEDFYCGTVDGDVSSPLMTSLNGSTFAAVRIDDPSDLPGDVPLDCAGNTASDS